MFSHICTSAAHAFVLHGIAAAAAASTAPARVMATA